MKRIIAGLIASVVSASAFAYNGAEVILGGVVGYIIGEKAGERPKQVIIQQPAVINMPPPVYVPPPRDYYGRQSRPVYRPVLVWDDICGCYRQYWEINQ